MKGVPAAALSGSAWAQHSNTWTSKQQHRQIVMNHQSDQIKTRKYFRYCLENANFSKFSGKGHKTKGQILKLSNASFWDEYSGILLFSMLFYGFTRARTLVYIHYIGMLEYSNTCNFSILNYCGKLNTQICQMVTI